MESEQRNYRGYLIDPPGGWLYGFPKLCDEDTENIRQWVIDNGYPKCEADRYGNFFHIRVLTSS